jgi:hypothetical protein
MSARARRVGRPFGPGLVRAYPRKPRPDFAGQMLVSRHARKKPRPDQATKQSPLPQVDELDESVGPPIERKGQPANAMDDVVPTLDDSDRTFPHHPNEPISEGFSSDPIAADAAADLAGELGADFIAGATSGRDMSDVMLSEDDTEGVDEDMVVDQMDDQMDDEEEGEER